MRRDYFRTKDVFGTMLFVILVTLFTSCQRNDDPLFGRWTVDKVNVDFDENVATPEMIRQYGELEKGNVIEIKNDSTMVFISDGDTLKSKCSLKGKVLYSDGKPFATLDDNGLVKREVTPLGEVTVHYSKKKP